jgi:hypothetical protein
MQTEAEVSSQELSMARMWQDSDIRMSG